LAAYVSCRLSDEAGAACDHTNTPLMHGKILLLASSGVDGITFGMLHAVCKNGILAVNLRGLLEPGFKLGFKEEV